MCFTPDGAFIGEARTRAALHALSGAKEDIQNMMRRQRRQLREARTCLSELSGGKNLYSPLELLLAAPDAIGVKASDQVTSVKGAAHHYEHHQLPGVIDPADPNSELPDQPRISREDAAAIAEADAALSAGRPVEEDTPDDLTDIHNFITTHNKGEDEE